MASPVFFGIISNKIDSEYAPLLTLMCPKNLISGICYFISEKFGF